MSLLLLLRTPPRTPATTASISDAFDDNNRDTAKWALGTLLDSSVSLTGTASETNQRVEILPLSGGSYAGYMSVNTEDLTGKRIFVKVSNTASMGFNQDAELSFGQSAGNSYNAVITGDGNLILQKRVANSFTNLAFVAYNATTHAWISLQPGTSGDDTVYLDTAPASAGNPPLESEWVQRLAVARDSSISRSAAKMGFSTGTFAATTPGTIYFDGFNTGTVGVTGYTLTADAGSYAITGTATALRAARTLTATPGTYAITGQAALLKRGFRLVAAVGSYAVTGTATTLRLARRLVANVGSYALTGTAALLKAGRRVVATPGSYTLTGQSVTLIKTGSYTLVAAPGSYAITGVPGGAYAARRLVAAVGSYSIAGQATGLSVARVLSATSGAYVLSGTAATLTYGPLGAYLLAVDPGAYALTGQAITLTYSPLVQLLFVRDTSPASVAVEGSPTPTTITLVATAAPPPATITGAAVAPFGAFVKVPAPPAVELEES